MRVRAIHTVKAGGVHRLPGTTFEWDDDYGNLDRLLDAGVVVEADEEDEPQEPENDLPEDLPGRAALLQAGIVELEAVRAHEDLTQVDGIGTKTAEAIAAFLEG